QRTLEAQDAHHVIKRGAGTGLLQQPHAPLRVRQGRRSRICAARDTVAIRGTLSRNLALQQAAVSRGEVCYVLRTEHTASVAEGFSRTNTNVIVIICFFSGSP